MAFWSWLLGRQEDDPHTDTDPPEPSPPIRLPTDPLVFECGLCGKVFEARRLHPTCPECDADDVELLSGLDP